MPAMPDNLSQLAWITTGEPGQILRLNEAGNAYEFYTPKDVVIE